MIEYGKYHILEGIYPHIGLHIDLLADGNIHNIKLIYRNISNNDHPVKTLLTFCGVYHGHSPDIKGNPSYTQLQKKPISHFSGQLWKSELRNENMFIPYSVAFRSASFH